jgi:hypothetical protein
LQFPVEVLKIYFPSDLKESDREFGVVGKILRRARSSKFRFYDPSFILRFLGGVSGHLGATVDTGRESVREDTELFVFTWKSIP